MPNSVEKLRGAKVEAEARTAEGMAAEPAAELLVWGWTFLACRVIAMAVRAYGVSAVLGKFAVHRQMFFTAFYAPRGAMKVAFNVLLKHCTTSFLFLGSFILIFI
jgi:hypothetical protein